MANRRRDAMFFIHKYRSGQSKGRRLIGLNHNYVGETPTAQDFLDFLKKEGIDPSDVPLEGLFMVMTKPI